MLTRWVPCLPAAVVILASMYTAPVSAGGGQRGIGEEEAEAAQLSHEAPLSPYSETDRIALKTERPYGIAVGPEDRIFVSTDRSVLLFAATGESVAEFALEEPARCLAVGQDGLLYLGMTDHVQVYTAAGTRLGIWASLGNEALITSITAAGGEVLVADAGNRMILRFDCGGKLLDYINGDGSAGPELIIPSPYFDLLLTPEGTLWAVNPGAHRLQSYDREGVYTGSWGTFSSAIEGFCGCCNPTHIALTPEGSFLTSEKGIPRVKEYDSAGTLAAVVAGPEHFTKGTVGLDLAVDGSGRVLVLDPLSKAVKIFSREQR
ncbi:MAG: NHL repeat-containing protein [Spirochaetaceae bacterium]|nr:MAG: NHL repeat-containing protein [Spirochaetaceae bacterium]